MVFDREFGTRQVEALHELDDSHVSLLNSMNGSSNEFFAKVEIYSEKAQAAKALYIETKVYNDRAAGLEKKFANKLTMRMLI